MNQRLWARFKCAALLCSTWLLACSATTDGVTGPSSAGASGADAGARNSLSGASATAGSTSTSGAGGASAGLDGGGAEPGGAPSAGAASGGGSEFGGAGHGGISGSSSAGASGAPGASGASGAGNAGSGNAGAAGYDPCPAKGSECRIMPMGDSITEGYRSTGYGGYRAPLFHLALSHQQSITFVGSAPPHGPAKVDGVAFPQANEGIGGRRIADLVGIVPTTITTNKPHILLLEIGTNDISEGSSSMASQLGNLLDKILAADPKLLVVVATVIPTTTDSKTATVEAYDKMIPALVKSRADAGKHIQLVDMFGTFTSNTKYKTAYFKSTDDLHPNDAGYALMADVWYAGIQSLLH
ncbi:MAG: SGNH/GDSL hydrolase family protein [Myxococcales bacterium]